MNNLLNMLIIYSMTPTDWILPFFLFLIVAVFCIFGGHDSSSSTEKKTPNHKTTGNNKRKSYNNSSDANNYRNRTGYGPYDPGEYYSEWGDDGGYE